MLSRIAAVLLGAASLAGIATAAEAQVVTRTVTTVYQEPVYAPPPAVVYGAPVYGTYHGPYTRYYAPRPVLVAPYAPPLLSFNFDLGRRGYDRGRHFDRGYGHGYGHGRGGHRH